MQRRWLTVHEQHIDLPHGGEIEEFHLVETPDWVAVLALEAEGRVVLVDQYRHGAGRTSRELPAGVIEPGESPEQAACRELLEETGYEATRCEPLIVVSTEPSRHTNRAHFFFAAGARRVREQRPDACENIAVVLVEQRELAREIDAGRILHGLHVGAILLAAHRGLIRLGA